MKINKCTKKFFSVASRPGNFGATVYNALFEKIGINAIYVPLGVASAVSFSRVFSSLELIGASGINISMPFKAQAASQSHLPISFDNINTLVRGEDQSWNGHNTDAHGFLSALQTVVSANKLSKIHIFGNGAVAHTIVDVLCAASPDCYIDLGKRLPTEPCDLFVNATPVGMPGVTQEIDWHQAVERSAHIFDVVISSPGDETNLVKQARKAKVPTVAGQSMCQYGLAKQFSLHFPGLTDMLAMVTEEMKAMGYDV